MYGIVGYGFVGRATRKGILNEANVRIHDLALGTQLEDLAECNYVFFCTPTDDQTDIEKLIIEIKRLKEINPACLIIIRSTVPIGTCKRLQEEIGEKIIYIPEFLRERFWEEDCLRRPLIIGTELEQLPTFLSDEEHCVCPTAEAELIKMFSNNFGVMRIAFANLFYDIAQNAGADYDTVKSLYFKIAHDQTYMEVPGHDGTRGFGGKCLPKDLDFLINTLESMNIDARWPQNIKELNEKWLKF